MTKERQRRHDPKKSRHAADHYKILLKSAALLFAARPTGIVKVEVAGKKSTGTSGGLERLSIIKAAYASYKFELAGLWTEN